MGGGGAGVRHELGHGTECNGCGCVACNHRRPRNPGCLQPHLHQVPRISLWWPRAGPGRADSFSAGDFLWQQPGVPGLDTAWVGCGSVLLD